MIDKSQRGKDRNIKPLQVEILANLKEIKEKVFP